jgi:hypothetical protein
VSEAARLQTLEDDNRRLKKLSAESMLDVSGVEKLMADHGFLRASRLQADLGHLRRTWTPASASSHRRQRNYHKAAESMMPLLPEGRVFIADRAYAPRLLASKIGRNQERDSEVDAAPGRAPYTSTIAIGRSCRATRNRA